MPIPENLPRDVRPQRLSVEHLTKLAKRAVYFPYDYQTTSGRHYKGDVRAAIGHGLAVELEREQQERQHNEELAALREEIAALSACLEISHEASGTGAARVSDVDPSDVLPLNRSSLTTGRVVDSPEPETEKGKNADAEENAEEDASEDATEDATMPDGGITR
ncbi:MAG: hypothetical protein ACR2M1_08370 [Gemmatimonadaceae bacterium]